MLSPTISLYSKKFQIIIFSGRRRMYDIPNAYNLCIYDTVSQPLKFFTTKFLSYNACVWLIIPWAILTTRNSYVRRLRGQMYLWFLENCLDYRIQNLVIEFVIKDTSVGSNICHYGLLVIVIFIINIQAFLRKL